MACDWVFLSIDLRGAKKLSLLKRFELFRGGGGTPVAVAVVVVVVVVVGIVVVAVDERILDADDVTRLAEFVFLMN